jgi:hypothetical protein
VLGDDQDTSALETLMASQWDKLFFEKRIFFQ